MLKVNRKSDAGNTLLALEGVVDENSPLLSLLTAEGPLKGEITLDCSGVLKINSQGVRVWLETLQKLTKQGVKFRLTECSPAIVECLNMILNFTSGAPVESILLPYLCQSCRAECMVSIKTSDIINTHGDTPPSPCPNCKSGEAVFDDLPEAYFQFLRFKRPAGSA